jgi:hypothetical protein
MGVTANHMLAGVMDVSIQSPFFWMEIVLWMDPLVRRIPSIN